MILPRRLFQTADREFCEEDDERQAWGYGPPGMIISDAEAEKIGLKAYLDRTGYGPVADPPVQAEAKAVAQAEVEDKAVAPEETKSKAIPKEEELEKGETLTPGLHSDPETRRIGGRRSST